VTPGRRPQLSAVVRLKALSPKKGEIPTPRRPLGDIEDSDRLKSIELHCKERAQLNCGPNQSLEPSAAATASSK
jgi:hypothetical protein